MALITRFHKKCRFAWLRVGLISAGLAALFIPNLQPIESVGDNIFTLYVNGNEIGKVENSAESDEILNEARRRVCAGSDNVVLIDADSELVGEEVYFGTTDDFEEMVCKVVGEYESSVKETMQKSFTVKIDDYMVSLSSTDEVVQLLDSAIHRFDNEEKFSTALMENSDREFPVYTPVINKAETENPVDTFSTIASDYLSDAGIYGAIKDVVDNVTIEKEFSFEDFDYGLTNVSFDNNVEVIESYLPNSQLTPIEQAIDDVTKDKEQKTIYVVKSGDSLSRISLNTGVSIDRIIELNDSIDNVNSVIRVGEELTVTVPEPELSIIREELVYYEGTYEADIIYKYNDSWYTTTEVTLQDPSSGYHKAVQKVTYRNNDLVSTEVVEEEVIAEAIPKIVEKGTKIPPTYIKPITGGVITSYFGGRESIIAGMSSYHQGIDWGVKLGTTVYASCGGTVNYAGWMSGYGYVVFINHPDGRQTRYAHLSKILVSKGQSVSQGEKIALSGSSGVSTGPHLHFEILINGKRVNPLKYLN